MADAVKLTYDELTVSRGPVFLTFTDWPLGGTGIFDLSTYLTQLKNSSFSSEMRVTSKVLDSFLPAWHILKEYSDTSELVAVIIKSLTSSIPLETRVTSLISEDIELSSRVAQKEEEDFSFSIDLKKEQIATFEMDSRVSIFNSDSLDIISRLSLLTSETFDSSFVLHKTLSDSYEFGFQVLSPSTFPDELEWYLWGNVGMGDEQGSTKIFHGVGLTTQALLYVKNKGSTGTTTIDILKNGISIFPTEETRPSLSVSDIDKWADYIFSLGSEVFLFEGDKLTLRVVDSAVDVSEMVVRLVIRRLPYVRPTIKKVELFEGELKLGNTIPRISNLNVKIVFDHEMDENYSPTVECIWSDGSSSILTGEWDNTPLQFNGTVYNCSSLDVSEKTGGNFSIRIGDAISRNTLEMEEDEFPFLLEELPSGVITIKDNLLFTVSQNVDVLLDYEGGEYMSFSLDGIQWSSWIAYSTEYTVDITASSIGGNSSDGLKTIYVRFRRGTTVTSTYSTTITYTTEDMEFNVRLDIDRKNSKNIDVVYTLPESAKITPIKYFRIYEGRGFAYDTVNLASGGTPSASSVEGSLIASNAFDGNTSTSWQSIVTGPLPQWLQYTYSIGQEKIVSKYSIHPYLTDANSVPTSWQFEGSNDGSNWVVLDTRAEQVLNQDSPYEYTFVNFGQYQYYRILFTDSVGGVYIRIKEIALYGIEISYEKTYEEIVRTPYVFEGTKLQILDAGNRLVYYSEGIVKSASNDIFSVPSLNFNGWFTASHDTGYSPEDAMNPLFKNGTWQWNKTTYPSVWLQLDTSKSYITCNDGIVSCDSGIFPEHAFDDNFNTYWRMENSVPNWIQIDYGVDNEKVIRRYVLLTGDLVSGYFYSWQLLASNDGSTWDILDTHTLEYIGDYKVYALTNTTAYRYYRIYVTNLLGTAPYGMGSILLQEYVEGLPSKIMDGYLFEDSKGASIKEWTIHGSNNGSDWVLLHTKSWKEEDENIDTKLYSFENSEAYKYYRWTPTELDFSTTQSLKMLVFLEKGKYLCSRVPELTRFDLTVINTSGELALVEGEEGVVPNYYEKFLSIYEGGSWIFPVLPPISADMIPLHYLLVNETGETITRTFDVRPITITYEYTIIDTSAISLRIELEDMAGRLTQYDIPYGYSLNEFAVSGKTLKAYKTKWTDEVKSGEITNATSLWFRFE